MSPRQAEPLTIEHALLGFLIDQPLHGYEIHQRLQQAGDLSQVWRLKQAHLYALLGKLEAAGLVTAELLPQDSRPPRRLLRLTDAGRVSFDAWIVAPVQHGRDLRLEFLAKLFWAQRLGGERAQALIASQRALAETWHAALQRQTEGLASEQRYERLVLQFRLTQVEAILGWLDRCEDLLSALAHSDAAVATTIDVSRR